MGKGPLTVTPESGWMLIVAVGCRQRGQCCDARHDAVPPAGCTSSPLTAFVKQDLWICRKVNAKASPAVRGGLLLTRAKPFGAKVLRRYPVGAFP